AAIAAIKGEGPRRVVPGDVLVLCCRGPMGSGMEETYQLTSALKYLSWGKQVAVITDARFSGVSTGARVGHVSPEALAGGPIGRPRPTSAPSVRLVPILGAQAAGASVVSSSSRTGSGSFSSPVCAPACGKMASAHSHRRTAPSASENVTVALPGHDTPPHRF